MCGGQRSTSGVFLNCSLHWLFLVNMTQTRVIREEGTSTKKILTSRQVVLGYRQESRLSNVSTSIPAARFLTCKLKVMDCKLEDAINSFSHKFLLVVVFITAIECKQRH